MSGEQDSRLAERNIPGMMNRRERFAEPEHVDDIKATVRRIAAYFVEEKRLVAGMLAVVLSGTLCGILAPSLQSGAVDIIAGEKQGILSHMLTLMLSVYLLYSICGLLQGLCSARLSQNVVRRMREELFGKIVELPVRYLDTHSHGDVMSRMTNDIENISTTVSQSLPSLFSGVLTVIGTMAVMLWYCWQLALLSFVTVLLTFLETKFLSGRVRRFSRKRQQLLGQLNGTVEEIVAEYHIIQIHRAIQGAKKTGRHQHGRSQQKTGKGSFLPCRNRLCRQITHQQKRTGKQPSGQRMQQRTRRHQQKALLPDGRTKKRREKKHQQTGHAKQSDQRLLIHPLSAPQKQDLSQKQRRQKP